CAGVVERAVAADRDDGEPEAGGHGDRLKGVEPAHAGRAHEHARTDGPRVLHDLELARLAVGYDVLDIHIAVGDELRCGLHHAVARADRIRGHHVDVGEPDGLGDRLAAGRELFGLDVTRFARFDFDGHYSSPPAAVVGFADGFALDEPAWRAAGVLTWGFAETPLFCSNHLLYPSWSFFQNCHLSSLSSNLSSSTMTMQSLTGQTCAQIPQPMHAW